MTILRELCGISWKTLTALLRFDRAAVRAQRCRLAAALVDGDDMRADRVPLALALLAPEAETITFRRQNIEWTGAIDCGVITRYLLVNGHWQSDECRSLMNWLGQHGRLGNNRNYCIDVGANIGTTALVITKDSDLKVLAIEPIPANYSLLRKNVENNSLGERVLTVQAAISSNRREITMVTYPGNSGAAEVFTESGPQGFGNRSAASRSYTVQGIPLDDLVAEQGLSDDQISFVWTDVQGFEHEVMESGQKLWKAGVPLYAEVWPAGLAAHGGVPRFMAAATTHFGSLLLSSDLIQRGPTAQARPIAELPAVFSHLSSAGEDILFLPRG